MGSEHTPERTPQQMRTQLAQALRDAQPAAFTDELEKLHDVLVGRVEELESALADARRALQDIAGTSVWGGRGRTHWRTQADAALARLTVGERATQTDGEGVE